MRFGGCCGRVDEPGGGGGWMGGSGSALVVNRMEQVRAELEEEWEARDDVGLSIVEIDPQTQVS